VPELLADRDEPAILRDQIRAPCVMQVRTLTAGEKESKASSLPGKIAFTSPGWSFQPASFESEPESSREYHWPAGLFGRPPGSFVMRFE
jgi:hypothetical protein